MSDATQSLSEDIAFIRNLVVDGQNNQFRGGISLAAGLIWGTASLYNWAAWSKVVDLPGGMTTANWSWAAAVVLFLLLGIPLGMYRRSGNRVVGMAWGAVGAACWTLSAAVWIAAWRTHQGVMFTLLPPIIMALYGGAWLVCGAALRKAWQNWIGVLCLLSSLLLAYTAAQPAEYLVFALSLYLFAALPGLLAVVRQRRAS